MQYVPDSDLDVPNECYSNAFSNVNDDNDDNTYYPGSRARSDNEDDRQRQLQQQLDRIQPSRWPTYVHTDRQGLQQNTDVDNDDETDRYRGEPHETSQANLSPSYGDNAQDEADEDQEQHQYRIESTDNNNMRGKPEYNNQRPTINGYGRSQPTDNDDETDGDHRHRHGPGMTTDRMDPNDVMEEEEDSEAYIHRQEEDEARQRAAAAAGQRGQRPNIDDEAAWRRPAVDPDDDDGDNDDNKTNSSDGAINGSSNKLRSDAQQQQPNVAVAVNVFFYLPVLLLGILVSTTFRVLIK